MMLGPVLLGALLPAPLVRSPPSPRTIGAWRVGALPRMHAPETDAADDPIYKDELWLRSGEVRYGSGSQGAGVGYCSSFAPWDAAGNHSRAILLLDPAPASETDLCALADKMALACECVALAPLFRGGAASWPRERLGAEAWAASEYLNAARQAESLAVVALGGVGSSTVLGLLAEGALGAHAAVALCPAGDARGVADTARAARELQVPLLAVCGTGEGGGDGGGRAYASALRESLALNAWLASDFYVAEFDDLGGDFLMSPRDAEDAKGGERALALVQSWVDRFCPEHLDRLQRRTKE